MFIKVILKFCYWCMLEVEGMEDVVGGGGLEFCIKCKFE